MQRLFSQGHDHRQEPFPAGRKIISCFMAYPAPNNMLAIFGGTDFSLANSRIIEPYFSMAKAPYGFTVDEAKWRAEYAT
jgi:hypothetical protein